MGLIKRGKHYSRLEIYFRAAVGIFLENHLKNIDAFFQMALFTPPASIDSQNFWIAIIRKIMGTLRLT